MKSDNPTHNSIDLSDISHAYCGTPDCCGSCKTAIVGSRIKRIVSNIYSYCKGIGVYLKYGHQGLRSKRRNRRK